MGHADTGLAPPLRTWVERVLDGPLVRADRAYVGGSRVMWYVTVEASDGEVVDGVLRVEEGTGMFSGTPISLQREARVYRALAGRGLPVAQLFGECDAPPAMLLERMAGSSDLTALDDDQRNRAYDEFIAAVAALHSVDVDGLDLEGFGRPATAEDHALLELDLWAGLAHERVDPTAREPLVEYALGWLGAHVPSEVQRTVLVHGDCGPGNFLTDGGSLTALVDWEFAHFGDPMDDLAWISARGGADILSGADGAHRLAAYERASGLAVVPGALAYYRVFTLARCAISTSMTISRGGAALGLAGYVVVHHQLLAQLAQALADAIGVAIDVEPMPEPVPTARTPFYDLAIADIVEGVVPHLANRDARLRARDALTFIHHLRLADQAGLEAIAPQVEDPAAAGARTHIDVLTHLFRKAVRDSALWVHPPARQK